MENIECVVFDLGGVLIDWNPRNMYKNVFNSEEDMEYFLTNICTGDWNLQQDKGRPFAEAIKIKQDEFPAFQDEIEMYFSRWNEMISGEITDTVKILTQLFENRKQRLYALTNWSQETFHYALSAFHFLKYFEGILVSGKEKMIKPDPEIYKLLVNRFDIDPQTSLFIDDSLTNVKGAEAFGMNAIHFSSPKNLHIELKRLNIL